MPETDLGMENVSGRDVIHPLHAITYYRGAVISNITGDIGAFPFSELLYDDDF